MGQIFKACAYDMDNMRCCVIDADKFHANCYSYSGAVFSMHYLLRQKPYRIMWGGIYVALWDNVQKFSRSEDLFGLSTYLSYDHFDRNNEDIRSKPYFDKIQFIGEKHKMWKKIDVWDEAKAFFNYEKTKSVKMSGYLLNHDKKVAIDLSNYFVKSISSFSGTNDLFSIDAIPVLTETGEGTSMVFDKGVSIDSTEDLAETWCGDLLQIVDDLPENYTLIPCCFADMCDKVKFCYQLFGTNEDNFVLSNNNGDLFKCAFTNFDFSTKKLYRLPRICNIKIVDQADGKYFSTVPVEENRIIDLQNSIEAAKAEEPAEGEANSLEKGEHKKAVAAALKMIEDGVPVENISKYTGLPQEQIEQLKNKNR